MTDPGRRIAYTDLIDDIVESSDVAMYLKAPSYGPVSINKLPRYQMTEIRFASGRLLWLFDEPFPIDESPWGKHWIEAFDPSEPGNDEGEPDAA